MKDDKRLKRKVRNSYIVSTVSITLAPILVIGGFVVEIYAIMKRY